MTSDEALQAHLKNDRERFLNILSSVVILDIGVIDYVDDNGRAHVTSSTFTNNRPVVYEDAEIIYPGNANGCFVAQSTGMACLIFLPKSCMPNVTDLKLFVGTTAYNRDGVKVMPIGNGTSNRVRSLFGRGGEYSIIGQEYKVLFDGETITFQRDDGTTSISIDGIGQMYVTRQTDTGTLTINIEDTGVTKKWLSQNKDVLWTDTYLPDGSRSFVQSDPNNDDEDAEPWFDETHSPDGTTVRKWLSKQKDVRWTDTVNSDGTRTIVQADPEDEDNPTFSISIGTDGTVTIGVLKGLTLESADALVLKGKSVSVSSTDGDVAIAAAKDQEGPGKVSITSADDTVITTGSGKKFAANGTNLEVDK